MDNASPNGDIGSAPAESATAPVAATTETPVDAGAAPISGQPESQGSLTTDATAQPGPIPYQRFAEVNRRMQEAEDRWKNTEQSWGEILKADPARIRTMLDWYQRAAADPVEHVAQLLTELGGHEQYRGKLASQAARLLGSLRQVQPREDPEPQPDLVAENGAPVMSAQRLREWQGWNQRNLQKDFDAKLQASIAPFKGMMEREQQAKLQQQANDAASQQYQRAQTWHGFKEHEAEIGKAFNANPSWTLQDAYLHVLHTKILPAMPAQAQAKVVADLQSKAAAQTLNPSGATKPASPDFGGDFKAALEHYSGKR